MTSRLPMMTRSTLSMSATIWAEVDGCATLPLSRPPRCLRIGTHRLNEQGWAGVTATAVTPAHSGFYFYAQLQQLGTIESFEPLALEPHCLKLHGFVIVRGNPMKLAQVRPDPDFQRLNGGPRSSSGTLAW